MNSKTRLADNEASISKLSTSSSRIFFLKENLLNTTTDIKIIRLRHPGTGEFCYFIAKEDSNSFYEVLQFMQPNRSWLVNENVSSDGKLYITIPIDTTFIALYYVKKHCSEKAMIIDQIDFGVDIEASNFLKLSITDSILEKISDIKHVQSLKAFKYNEDKAKAWLAIKIKRLAKVLKAKNIKSLTSATSANYIKSINENNLTEDEYLLYAAGIIENYIPMSLYTQMIDYLCLEKTINMKKRKSLQVLNPINIKKIKSEEEEFNEQPTPKKINTKEKQLAKAASGTKTLFSFFKKN